MRSIALIFVIGFLVEFYGHDALAQQLSAAEASREAARVADRMAVDLARTLPKRLTATAVKKTSARDVKMATPSQAAAQSGDAKSQQERPRVQVPQDKPLGAAGQSRDKRKPDVEDADFMVIQDRWRVGVPEDPRFQKGSILNPYRQNILKGDYPIIGDNIFMNFTLASESAFQLRRIPVPQDVSSAQAGGAEFFGRGRQELFSQNFVYSIDLFQGDTSFKPADWRFKIKGVTNLNLLNTRENGLVNVDVREGKSRLDGFNSIDEAFFEVRLGDTPRVFPFLRGRGSRNGRSPQFDSTSLRVGIQPFTSDFRGFIFSDSNLGVRLFGNYGANRWQYNLAYFNTLEKETNSGLNTVNFRDIAFRNQNVYIANLYRQDTFVKGYTTQFSLHFNDDRPSLKYDENGALARPARVGVIRTHRIDAGYLGWAGDGHFGKLNVTHAFYQALGRDSFNQIARRAQRINAQMAAAEGSMDFDYIRFRLGAFYASGDGKPNDGTARGFDSILDAPNFAGGPFSFWNSQGFKVPQTGVVLVDTRSLLPSLRSSKLQGQSNFVNPGVTLYNAGVDVDVTPKLRGFLNYNYLRFNRTEPLQQVLFQGGIRHEIGHDAGLGFIYRPLLNENVTLIGGASTLIPGRGLTDIFTSNCNGTPAGCGSPRPVLWTVFVTARFVY